jgi:E3 ubiquitin-protein ligase HECTD2
VNDLKPPLEKVCLQAPLTLRYLKQMINDCKRMEGLDTTNAPKDSFYQPIEQVVDAAFGNWMCLNDSFLTVSGYLSK